MLTVIILISYLLFWIFADFVAILSVYFYNYVMYILCILLGGVFKTEFVKCIKINKRMIKKKAQGGPCIFTFLNRKQWSCQHTAGREPYHQLMTIRRTSSFRWWHEFDILATSLWGSTTSKGYDSYWINPCWKPASIETAPQKWCYLCPLMPCLARCEGLHYKTLPYFIHRPSVIWDFGNKLRFPHKCATNLGDILIRMHLLNSLHPDGSPWWNCANSKAVIKGDSSLNLHWERKMKVWDWITCNTQFTLLKCPCGFYFVESQKHNSGYVLQSLIISKAVIKDLQQRDTLKQWVS